MKKIAVSGYVGSHYTGISRYLHNLLENLIQQDSSNKYIIFINHDNNDFDQLKIFDNIFFVKMNISKHNSFGNLMWHQFILPIHLMIRKIDVLFIPNVTLLLFKVCKSIVVIHDLIEFNVPKKFSRLRMLYRKFAVPLTAKSADYIITVSNNSKKDIIKYCKVKPDKIKVIYNGVDNSFYPMKNGVEKNLLKKYSIVTPYILYVGSIDHPGKNSNSLIRAFSVVLKDYADYKLVLIGKPGFGYEKVINTIEKLGIRNSVILPGYIADKDLPSIYNGAKLFVFLSLYEGFGLPLIEAMACGTPIIASNRSCFPEILGKMNVLVDPFDIDEIVEKMLLLINDERFYNEISNEGLKRSKLYNWEDAAIKTMSIFNSISKRSINIVEA